MPRNDKKLQKFTLHVLDLLAQNKSAWGINDRDIRAIESGYQAYNSALSATRPAIRRSDIAIKTEVKELLINLLNNFFKDQFEHNKLFANKEAIKEMFFKVAE